MRNIGGKGQGARPRKLVTRPFGFRSMLIHDPDHCLGREGPSWHPPVHPQPAPRYEAFLAAPEPADDRRGSDGGLRHRRLIISRR